MHPSLRLRVGLGEHDRALARVEMPTADGVAPSFPFVRVWFADVGANAPEACQFAGSAGRLASSEVSRLGGARRLAVRRHNEGLLEGRGATVHNTRIDDGMALKLDGQRLEESPALLGMDGRGGGLDGVVLVVTELSGIPTTSACPTGQAFITKPGSRSARCGSGCSRWRE